MQRHAILALVTVGSLLAAAASAAEINQESFDVRLVAAEISPDLVHIGEGADVDVQITSCVEKERDERYTHGVHAYDSLTLDCRDAVEALLATPVLGDVRVYVNVQPGTSQMFSPGAAYKARRVDLYTAMRGAALAPAAGIGFMYGAPGNYDTFIPKADLLQFATATNAAGEQMVVNRFAGLFEAQSYQSLILKPYARYDTATDSYKNWENLAPRADSGTLTGGFGTGNYAMRTNERESIRFTDVITENHLIPSVVVAPTPTMDTEFLAIDIVTLTHRNGNRDVETALFPYVYGVDLPSEASSATVEAGKEAWIRLADQAAQGRDPHLVYQLNGGAVVDAPYYLGGNCYGFDKCFEIATPADASGEIAYRFELRDAANPANTVTLDDGGQPFRFRVAAPKSADIAVTSAGVTTSGTFDPARGIGLHYDPALALAVLNADGITPDGMTLQIFVSFEGGDALKLPLGRVSSYQDADLQLAYRAKMADLVFQAPAGAHFASFAVEISTYNPMTGTLRTAWDNNGGAGYHVTLAP